MRKGATVVHLSRPGWRLAAVSAALITGLASALPGSAAADDRAAPSATPQVIATGLNNARHLRWSNGSLYVAEAGTGGNGPCLPSAEGGNMCLGATGSITRVWHGRQRRVVTGLPSLAAPSDGHSAIGPSDVRVKGMRYTVALGLAGDPTRRSELGRSGRRLATVSTGRLGSSRLTVLADLAAHEALENPDKKMRDGQRVLDTNPVALLPRGRSSFVVDAGGNDLLRYQDRDVETRAVFPSVQVPGPGGAPFPMDAVPTAAVNGPDRAIYVSQLTGFPFPPNGASIWRVAPGQKPTKYATGLNAVTDLAFGPDGSLYAVQLSATGLGNFGPGSVVRIPRGGGDKHSIVADGLPAPYGISLHRNSAYVTTHATEAGKGQVVKIALPHSS
jgi:hypothetical protein